LITERLYPRTHVQLDRALSRFHKKDREVLRGAFKRLKGRKPIQEAVLYISEDRFRWYDARNTGRSDSADWFVQTGYAEYLNNYRKIVEPLLRTIEARISSKAKALDELLGVGRN
jgi:hypothetical protein